MDNRLKWERYPYCTYSTLYVDFSGIDKSQDVVDLLNIALAEITEHEAKYCYLISNWVDVDIDSNILTALWKFVNKTKKGKVLKRAVILNEKSDYLRLLLTPYHEALTGRYTYCYSKQVAVGWLQDLKFNKIK